MKAAAKQAVFENSGAADCVATDLSVSCDNTWMKRGHTSLHGVSSVISVDTGKVLDVQVMSKHCTVCALHTPDNNKNKEKDWCKDHSESCSRNYSGSSGGMEPAGMKLIFHRSVEKYGVRYTRYLGDGDSSAFKTVSESQPYGDQCIIQKLECIGHIQKRMGGRLRRLVEQNKGKVLKDGKPIGGKNRLTKKRIDSLQNYYGNAIRSNLKNLDSMQHAVWSTWFHYLSTDEHPQHGLCSETWCKYKIMKESGGHFEHKNSLPEEVMLTIKPVYQALCDRDLLKKCLHGKTESKRVLQLSYLEEMPKDHICV